MRMRWLNNASVVSILQRSEYPTTVAVTTLILIRRRIESSVIDFESEQERACVIRSRAFRIMDG